MSYADAKYGVIQRKWFGLHNKLGGEYTSPLTNDGSASTKTLVERWYPRGPIEVVKVGWMSVATASAANNATGASDRALFPIKFYKSNAAGTARSTMIADIDFPLHPTENLPSLWEIGSTETIASAEVEAGRFITVFAASAESNEGTQAGAVGTIMMGGSFACFIDFIPKYHQSKWTP